MSEFRVLLEETVERLLADHVTKDSIEAAERGEWAGDLWQALESGGLLRPHLGEDAGGAGGSWLEAFVILRASGRHAAPLPIGETLLGSWLLARAGLGVPEGPVTVSGGLAKKEGRLSGVAEDVPWARACAHVVAVDGDEVFLVETAAATEIRHGENVAREPRDTLRFEDASVVAAGRAGLPPEVVRLYGALVRGAQMAGALESILAQSVRYAGERVQFGRPIGAFQIIQQELARLAGETAAAGVAAEAAFRAAARRDETAGRFDPRFEIAVAKTRIGDAVDRATGIAHQVHGAIGFTYEHGLHFATRRLWSWRAEHGTDSWWAAELGRAVLARGADSLWPDLTGRRLG